ncbi:3-deoxy-manno-octulosonate cytidylyltransferase [bacterium]|nr:3-deoxy-manno-octulosonate cytidylyltransferase [bacterium]
MKPPRTVCVIPARYASSRFPGKPLKSLLGRPMILHTIERAKSAANVDWVIVATDDERIARVVRESGHDAVMTPELPSGTHRVAWVARNLNCRFVLNLQGDEPLIDPALLNALVSRLADGRITDDKAEIVTAVHREDSAELFADRNCVKAVLASSGQALYFSRAAIPHDRDGSASNFWRHVGLYGFTHAALQRAVELPASELEEMEKLEQLRWLAGGMRIDCVETDWHGYGVDTPADLRRVEDILQNQKL